MASIAILGRDGGRPFRYSLAEGCSVAPDRTPGLWLEESLTPLIGGLRLHHLVPPIYERYVRILYPAKDRLGCWVRWEDVARHTGRRMHPDVQWEPLRNGPLGSAPDGLVSPWHSRDAERHVSLNLKRTLFGDAPPSSCWMAAWAGFGGLTESFDAPLIRNVTRDYMLFRTTADGVDDFVRPSWWPLPGLWWPEDRSYFVGTDTDVCWAYVGGSWDLVDRILDNSELETLEVDADHRGDYLGDTINGPELPTYR